MSSYLMNGGILASSIVVFVVIYVVSFLIVLGFDDWMMIWMGMEMNMFSFISMVYKKESWVEVESLFSYFFIQGVSSAMFLVMVYVGWGLEVPLMMKMAAGPFFFWLPSVMVGLSWGVCFIMMSFQKVIPLVIMSGMVESSFIFWGLVGVVIGVVGSFGQVLMKALMAYSSVSHVGWMMLSLMFEEGLWVMYFIMYVMVMGMMIMYFYGFCIEGLVGMKGSDLMVFFFLVVSMSGVPPFLGFLMKWLVLERVVYLSGLVSMILIVSSLVMVYIYTRMVYENMMGGVSYESWVDVDMGMMGVVIVVVGTFMFPIVVWLIL